MSYRRDTQMKPMELKPEELLYFRKGNAAIFKKVVDLYHGRIYANAIRLVKNQNNAEEITQRVFVKSYLECKKFRGACKLSVWLYRITFNECLSFIKKQKRGPSLSIESLKENSIPPPIAVLHDCEGQRVMIDRAMDTLKPKERVVLVLWYFEELSYKEISERTGLTLSNVKVKLHRAKQKLKQMLQPHKQYLYER